MRGSIRWQVQHLFLNSGINRIGQSKHAAKVSAREQFHEKNSPATSHALAKETGIHSIATADAYRDVWQLVGNLVKQEYGVRDLETLSGEHIQAFLESKIAAGVAHSTFMQYAAACEKMETALNLLAGVKGSGRSYDFTASIENARADAHRMLARFEGSRAYADPQEILKQIREPVFHLVAKVQLEGGARISEVNHLKVSQLKGIDQDRVTGRDCGLIRIEKGKGGKDRDMHLSAATYERLKAAVISQNNRLEFDKDRYRNELKRAALASGQKYQGSHGLRWNYARDRFREVQRHGQTYEQAMIQVSRELGHERADITEHYLR